jgi:hypothetical protein
MIRHILLFTFREGASSDDIQTMLAEFSRFPERFPQMRDWQFGRNSSRRDQHYEYAMTVHFQDRPALDAYLESIVHETFVAERFQPLVARRAIATFEVPTIT